jgi:sodium/proline symporter
MGIRSASAVPFARRIGVGWVVTALAGAVLVGLSGIAVLDQPLDNPETVFIVMIQQLLNPWVGGILLAAVLAAVMSTADSQLIVSSTALTEDFYRAFLNKDASDMTLVWVGRLTVVGVAVVAYVLALQGGAVLDIVAYAWAGFGAAFGPVVILSLFWPKMTKTGAYAGIIGGAATVLLWERLDGILETGLYEMVPGVIVATALAIGFGRVGSPPERQWEGGYAEGEPAEPQQEGDNWVVEQRIKQGVEWSDGTEITAQDFVFTVETVHEFELSGNWPPWLRLFVAATRMAGGLGWSFMLDAARGTEWAQRDAVITD